MSDSGGSHFSRCLLKGLERQGFHTHETWYKEYRKRKMDGFAERLTIQSRTAVILRSTVRDITALDTGKGLYARRPHVPVQHGTDVCGSSVHDCGAVGRGCEQSERKKMRGAATQPRQQRSPMIGPNGHSARRYIHALTTRRSRTCWTRRESPGDTMRPQTDDTNGGGFTWSAYGRH